MKKQAFNPYLPSYEYVPDGEPHVFGDRVYVYGSHDRFNGAAYCMNDYICYSAPVDDLGNWRCEGVIYKKTQDPYNDGSHPNPKDPGVIDGIHCMYAPDVCQGTDGRYYLYYCLDNISQVGVAVCDTPCGKFEFLSYVKDRNGNVLGQREGDIYQFDPGVLVDDDGRVYLYTGNSQMIMKPEAIVKRIWPNNHSMVTELESDMVTAKTEPKKLIPNMPEAVGTDFDGHAFFEASSIRKIGNMYYFVYSDINCHNLCYATSDKPMEGFKYRGVLVSNGDIGLDGRVGGSGIGFLKRTPTAPTGNNHGGMVNILGQWYIFYHRQTNCHDHSRQTCAEKIYIKPDGSIDQVHVTSCGLNDGALKGEGLYPSYIACNLWNARRYSGNSFSFAKGKVNYPYITQDGEDREEGENQYVANIKNGYYVGYKYFAFDGLTEVSVTVRGKGKGVMEVFVDPDKAPVAKISVEGTPAWTRYFAKAENTVGEYPLYFRYVGNGSLQLKEFELKK